VELRPHGRPCRRRAFFLASRRTDGYPEWGWTVPGTRAVIWRRPRVEVRGPEDFPARGGLELVLHGHDVCAGLGVPLRPPPAEIARLIEHTRGWPHWQAPGWRPVASGGDPWAELLAAAGRQPAGTGMSPP
jgi:hypothetical protein